MEGVILKVFMLLGVVVSMITGEQKCVSENGGPLTYNGLNCASTSRSFDYQVGACGCGNLETGEQASWAHYGFTAAVNTHWFDYFNDVTIKCGSSCGRCVKLTTTGGYIEGHGDPVPEGESQTFMIVNGCRAIWPNEKLCNQNESNGLKNDYGYEVHFNLEDGAGQLTELGWGDKNPEVTYDWLFDCEQAHIDNYLVPDDSRFAECDCYGKLSTFAPVVVQPTWWFGGFGPRPPFWDRPSD